MVGHGQRRIGSGKEDVYDAGSNYTLRVRQTVGTSCTGSNAMHRAFTPPPSAGYGTALAPPSCTRTHTYGPKQCPCSAPRPAIPQPTRAAKSCNR
jgi:hypothetical protein